MSFSSDASSLSVSRHEAGFSSSWMWLKKKEEERKKGKAKPQVLTLRVVPPFSTRGIWPGGVWPQPWGAKSPSGSEALSGLECWLPPGAAAVPGVSPLLGSVAARAGAE